MLKLFVSINFSKWPLLKTQSLGLLIAFGAIASLSYPVGSYLATGENPFDATLSIQTPCSPSDAATSSLCNSTRQLTQGEAALTHAIFGNEISIDQIRISYGGVNGNNLATTRRFGNLQSIEFKGPTNHFNNYAGGVGSLARSLFYHELLHAWQYQTEHRYMNSVSTADQNRSEALGLITQRDKYKFEMGENSSFSMYSAEQQAKIFEIYMIMLEQDRQHLEMNLLEQLQGFSAHFIRKNASHETSYLFEESNARVLRRIRDVVEDQFPRLQALRLRSSPDTVLNSIDTNSARRLNSAACIVK